ncbi:hypothetical protein TNCV_2872451 [Trichonephila clavipes]|nr:hypothetical protein TNCV_2872451 [Trichonephila clavipes]
MLPVLGKKAVLEWCMKEGLIGLSYVCPKCGKSMELRERTGSMARSSAPYLETTIFLVLLSWLVGGGMPVLRQGSMG